MTCRIVAAVLPISLLVPALAPAAEDASSPVGARIRVTAPSVSDQLFESGVPRIVGTLVALDDESLSMKIASRRDPIVVPRASVEKLQVSRRRGKKLWGALGGLAVGTSIGLASSTKGSSFCGSQSLSGCDAAMSVLVLGVPLGIVGFLAAPGEKWEDAPLPSTALGLSIAPTRGRGFAAALSISF